MRSRFSLGLTATLLLVPALAVAVKFPDVAGNYPHATAIEKLSERGIINGNPDGTFRPHDP